MRRIAQALTALVACWGLAPAAAQEDPNEGAREGVEVFEPDYFDVYNPVTAMDLVRNVPGFSVSRGDNRRGFGGTASNVLVNGERPSSKEPIFQTLNRIAARNVLRVELIRGGAGAAASDVRGQSELVNIILREGAESGSTTTYQAQLNYQPGAHAWWFLRGAQSFRLGAADALFEISLPSNQGREDRLERVFGPGGDLLLVRDEYSQNNFREVSLNGALSWDPTAIDTINVNAQLSPRFSTRRSGSVAVDDAGDPAQFESSKGEDDGAYSAEVGADWERELAENLSFKLVGLASHSTNSSTSLFERHNADGSLSFASLTERETTNGERIARGSFSWRFGDHAIEAGLETAFNFRDTAASFFLDTGGGFVPTSVGVDTTRVEELRGEAFISDVWVLGPQLTLESGFTFEASRISQSGDAEAEREFTYPKPRVIATYRLANDDQIRVTVERDVDQLDFSAFASSTNPSEGTEDAGNPELVPEKTWRYRINWERRFGQRGSVSVEAFLDQVEDVEEFTVLRDAMGNITGEADGNIGDGERRGLRLNASIPFDSMGLENATLGLGATLQESEVTDPLTMQTRQFQYFDAWRYSIDFRHDVPGRSFSYGGRYSAEDGSRSFRLDQIVDQGQDEGRLNLFVETTRIPGVTVRFNVDNVLDQTRTRERTRFDTNRDTGSIEEVERRFSQDGRVFSVRVAGTF